MRHRAFVIILFVSYIIGMTGIMIWQGIGIAPDRYAFVLLLGSLLIKRTRSFILDWIPFLFILISYDFLRGFATFLNPRVHYVELINVDLWLFKTLPTQYLQGIFYHPGQIGLIDFLATILYFLHFALPLGFGFILWLDRKKEFKEFTTGLLLISYSAWIAFVIFPAAPPWLAEQKGYIHGVTKILDHSLALFPARFDLPTVYHNINPNPVAAFPSLHAGYPMLVLLYAFRFFKKKALWFLPYCLASWFSVVYLGEHYVTDVLGGIVFAVIFFVVAIRLPKMIKFHPTWLKKIHGDQ